MGENDWLYPEEARLLDEEFYYVQDKISKILKSQLKLLIKSHNKTNKLS